MSMGLNKNTNDRVNPTTGEVAIQEVNLLERDLELLRESIQMCIKQTQIIGNRGELRLEHNHLAFNVMDALLEANKQAGDLLVKVQ